MNFEQLDFSETSSKLVLWPTLGLNNLSYMARRCHAHASGAQCFICGCNFWPSSIASHLFSSAEMHSNNCFHCSVVYCRFLILSQYVVAQILNRHCIHQKILIYRSSYRKWYVAYTLITGFIHTAKVVT
jgi:hypothetical protein